MIKKIMFTGSRDWTDTVVVDNLLSLFKKEKTTIVVGCCPTGLDYLVREWCQTNDQSYYVFRADWGKHNLAAGPIRNQAMVDSGPDLCFAFLKLGEKNKGTHNAISKAKRAGVPVFIIEG